MMRGWRAGSSGKAILTLGAFGVALVGVACAGAPNSAVQSAPKHARTPAATGAAEPEMGGATESAIEQAPNPLVPIRVDDEKLAGVGLEEYAALPADIVLEGGSGHRGHVFFSGDEIVVEVWEADAATLAITDPFPYDEFVTVVSGKLVLTDNHGTKTEYEVGESLVVPKGFTGTWQMIGNYRELVVIEKEAYVREEEGE